MSDQGYTPPGAPPNTPGLPQNPLPIVWQGFEGLNTKAAQQGIKDQEMFVCDGFMPLGPNNLRVLRDLGGAIYTAPGILTIKSFGFGNIGATPICIVCLSDGSLIQVNTNTLVQTTIGGPGTITNFNMGFSQWSSLYSIIVSAQTNGYFLWDGASLFKSGSLSPQVTVINGGSNYTSPPTITTQSFGAQATGYIDFTASGNPTNGQTITLNGVVWTFVSGSAGAHQTHIQGTLGFTLFQLTQDLSAASDAGLVVATYNFTTNPPSARSALTIVYNTSGTVGNAYTLAASTATPSGATLTGGVNGGAGATFTGVVTNGSLTSVKVTNPGSGYTPQEDVILTITGGGSDNMASATPVISTDSGIASVTVNNGGQGYSALVSVTPSGGGASVEATFSVVGSNGVITQVIVQNPGIGYTSVPSLLVADLASGAVGTGAVLTAVLAAGQIGSVTVNTPGSGYVTAPILTVVGDGVGAVLQANISASAVSSIDVVNAGIGYTHAGIQFNGGNNGAAAVASLMPFGVSGTSVETYVSRVWVVNGRTGQESAPGDPTDFSAADGSDPFESNDSFLKVAYQKLIQSNGFLYILGDSSMNYISGVSTSGNPAITTFNNLNVDPQIGTPWPDTVQAFGRDIVFANSIGVYVSYGGSVTKVSDALDGIYATVPESSWTPSFKPSAAVMTIFGIQVYILLMQVIDQVTEAQVTKCLMWDGKKWWTSPQTGLTIGFAATQEINSVLTAYCSPEGVTIKPMFTTPTKADTMTKYLYSKLWDNGGVFTTKVVRQVYAIMQANANSLGTQASGYIQFAANPSPGDTITLNGVVWTFVTGTAVGNQTQIQGTAGFTIVELGLDLTASTNPLLMVASYLGNIGPPVRINITYNAAVAQGNTYTLASSSANGTPSGAHLTGGTDPEAVYFTPIREAGLGTEVGFFLQQVGPVIIGPIPYSDAGRIIGIRVRTTTQDVQMNSITIFTNIQQSNV